MEAVRVQQVVTKDGEVIVTGLPYKRGQVIEIILLAAAPKRFPRSGLTAGQLRQSGLIGMWKDREDIQDSAVFARQLREQAQQRGEIRYDLVG